MLSLTSNPRLVKLHAHQSTSSRVLGSEVKVTQSCPTLCDPMDYRVHGILQPRILEWVAGSSPPRDQTGVSCIAGRLFTRWAMREFSIATYSLFSNSLSLHTLWHCPDSPICCLSGILSSPHYVLRKPQGKTSRFQGEAEGLCWSGQQMFQGKPILKGGLKLGDVLTRDLGSDGRCIVTGVGGHLCLGSDLRGYRRLPLGQPVTATLSCIFIYRAVAF